MERRQKTIIIIAWTIIGLWLTRGLLFRLLGVDFATTEAEQNFRCVWLVLIPFSIDLLIYASWKDVKFNLNRLLTLGLATTLSFVLILILNFFSGTCEWRFSEPFYRNKDSETIVRYHTLDCGATDGNPTNDLVKTYNIGPYLIKYEEISREELNQPEWIKQ